MERDATRYWGYALILLATVSGFFLTLRFLGRAFVALDFELLIIHVPTVICLLIYATKMRSFLPARTARGDLPETEA